MRKIIIGLSILLFIIFIATLVFTGLTKQKDSPLTSDQKTRSTPTPTPPIVRTFVMYVKNWQFEPSVMRFRRGDRITLQLKSLDVKHGFSLPAYNLNATLDPFKVVTVQFTANKSGTFEYICTINCGPRGYTGMKGTLIVE